MGKLIIKARTTLGGPGPVYAYTISRETAPTGLVINGIQGIVTSTDGTTYVKSYDSLGSTPTNLQNISLFYSGKFWYSMLVILGSGNDGYKYITEQTSTGWEHSPASLVKPDINFGHPFSMLWVEDETYRRVSADVSTYYTSTNRGGVWTNSGLSATRISSGLPIQMFMLDKTAGMNGPKVIKWMNSGLSTILGYTYYDGTSWHNNSTANSYSDIVKFGSNYYAWYTASNQIFKAPTLAGIFTGTGRTTVLSAGGSGRGLFAIGDSKLVVNIPNNLYWSATGNTGTWTNVSATGTGPFGIAGTKGAAFFNNKWYMLSSSANINRYSTSFVYETTFANPFGTGANYSLSIYAV
ncbi:MAG: hypothetical protein HC836_16790 [Richelia sp. RM2_1_2]|nr:hypothetical protein [Richelia sp. RM2_1_2]